MSRTYMQFTTLIAGLFLSGSIMAQDLPSTKLKVIGSFSNLNAASAVEKPFWTEKLPSASGGAISVEYTSLDQLGLTGNETLRLMRTGVISFASSDISNVAADNIAFNALGLPGLLTTPDVGRKAADAYKQVLDQIMRKDYNSRLMMLWPAPPQVIYCRPEVKGLTDLANKKVRVGNKPLSALVTQLNGVPVTLPFSEAVSAFQRGTVDCGVTGTLSGNTAKWPEVTEYFMPLNLGYAMWFHAVNLDRWNEIDPKVQAFLEGEMKKLEDDLWANAALEAQDGINCNTGQGECRFGTKQQMKLVPVTHEDEARLTDILVKNIIPEWAASCGEACVKDFNSTIGAVTGITATP